METTRERKASTFSFWALEKGVPRRRRRRRRRRLSLPLLVSHSCFCVSPESLQIKRGKTKLEYLSFSLSLSFFLSFSLSLRRALLLTYLLSLSFSRSLFREFVLCIFFSLSITSFPTRRPTYFSPNGSRSGSSPTRDFANHHFALLRQRQWLHPRQEQRQGQEQRRRWHGQRPGGRFQRWC